MYITLERAGKGSTTTEGLYPDFDVLLQTINETGRNTSCHLPIVHLPNTSANKQHEIVNGFLETQMQLVKQLKVSLIHQTTLIT